MQTITIPEALSLAHKLHQSGRKEEAEKLCRQVLEAAPDHADARRLLESLGEGPQSEASALELLEKIRAAPGDATVYEWLLEAAKKDARYCGYLWEAVDALCDAKVGDPLLLERLALFLIENGNIHGTERLLRLMAERFNLPRHVDLYRTFHAAFLAPSPFGMEGSNAYITGAEREHQFRTLLRLLGDPRQRGNERPCFALIPHSTAARADAGLATDARTVLYEAEGEPLLEALRAHSSLGTAANQAIRISPTSPIFVPRTPLDTAGTPMIRLAGEAETDIHVQCRFAHSLPRLGTLMVQIHGLTNGKIERLPILHTPIVPPGTPIDLFARAPVRTEAIRLIFAVSGRRPAPVPDRVTIVQGHRFGAYLSGIATPGFRPWVLL